MGAAATGGAATTACWDTATGASTRGALSAGSDMTSCSRFFSRGPNPGLSLASFSRLSWERRSAACCKATISSRSPATLLGLEVTAAERSTNQFSALIPRADSRHLGKERGPVLVDELAQDQRALEQAAGTASDLKAGRHIGRDGQVLRPLLQDLPSALHDALPIHRRRLRGGLELGHLLDCPLVIRELLGRATGRRVGGDWRHPSLCALTDLVEVGRHEVLLRLGGLDARCHT